MFVTQTLDHMPCSKTPERYLYLPYRYKIILPSANYTTSAYLHIKFFEAQSLQLYAYGLWSPYLRLTQFVTASSLRLGSGWTGISFSWLFLHPASLCTLFMAHVIKSLKNIHIFKLILQMQTKTFNYTR